MQNQIRLVWTNPHEPQPIDAHNVALNFDALTVCQFLELAALVSDTHFQFNADGTVSVVCPDVIALPDERPRPHARLA